MMRNQKIILVGGSAWLFFAAAVYMLGFFVFDQPRLEQLAKSGIATYGRVTAKEAENHRAVRYVYIVDGQEYSGSGRAGAGNPEFDEIQIGQLMVVFYLPTKHDESFLGYPELLVEAHDGLIFLMVLVVPLFPTVFIVAISIAFFRSKA